ncbi:MAG: GMC family oxidoreductase N-terminal domain-containing protein [Rubrivivax sp.]|nr:GMC family oxidoreductase N-terminal domain-containing protein [Rubrivivax sp.]
MAQGSDIVIVGAGSAGCVLAARLSEDPACRVTLIEAGGEADSDVVRQPSQWPLLWDREENWGYSTTAQRGYALRSILCQRGKGLGGSSAINAMIVIRGDAHDFDHWRDLGNPGWGWRDVLPYFIRSEDHVLGASAWHGAGGPLAVTAPTSPNPIAHAFVDAAVACGHRRNPDFNGEHRDGAGLYHLSVRDGVRCSAAAAYLRPAMARPNLEVLTKARALRVALDGDRAVGVDVFDGLQVRRIDATQEVLVCAGAIDSPKLLMLSGIGDPAALQAHGIGVKHALPAVGRHLCDHPGAALALALKAPIPAQPSSNLVEAGLFMKSARSSGGYATEIQFLVLPQAPGITAARGRSPAMAIVVQSCRPLSRGSVTLRSADPLDAPLIDPAYMTAPEDLALQIEGLREARRIAAAGPLARHLTGELAPGLTATADADLERHIRGTGGCINHPVGTCRMGPGEDAVVNAELRVHGLLGLRVVDASVMPQITSGNTDAPTIMIAEKAADLIRRAA